MNIEIKELKELMKVDESMTEEEVINIVEEKIDDRNFIDRNDIDNEVEACLGNYGYIEESEIDNMIDNELNDFDFQGEIENYFENGELPMNIEDLKKLIRSVITESKKVKK